MEKALKREKKRSQCDYTMGFKLAVVQEVEKGNLTPLGGICNAVGIR